ncbi:uncharacterized protein [Narcine bancroftii]
MVQVLNENDNSPVFLEESIQPLNISELTPVGKVLFTLQSYDKDGDSLVYVIDRTLDAEFFKIDLPSSGKVLLAQSLDYEIKKDLNLLVYAMEVNTKERYNTTAKMTINVLDGDDQYPRFLPCDFLIHRKIRICINPIYTGNVTETKLPYHALKLSPGPLLAEDGDKGLKTPVYYSILTGGDNGRFEVNNVTGAIMMRWPVRSFLKTPLFSLTVMAFQADDPMKYTVTTVLIRVLARNRYRPRFNTKYEGFIQEQSNLLAPVVTYGNKLLLVEAIDQDFKHGRNPNIVYRLTHQSNHTQLFQVTQEGLLLARTDQLHAQEKYMIQLVGTDKESGDVISTRIQVEVLHSNQPVPSGLTKESRKYSFKEMGLVGGITAVLFLFIIFALALLIRNGREWHRHRRHRGMVAIEQSTNVRLKWFQMDNTNKSVSSYSNLGCRNEGYRIDKEESNNECATSNLGRISNVLLDAAAVQEPESMVKVIMTNGKQVQITDCKSVCFKSNVMAKKSHTTPKHQCSECKNEHDRVFEDYSLQSDLQSPRRAENNLEKADMEKGMHHEKKVDISEFIKDTAHKEVQHLETMLEETGCSVMEEDFSDDSSVESNCSTSAIGQEIQETAEQKQPMPSPEHVYPVTAPTGQAHVKCSLKAGALDPKVQIVITEHSKGTDYPALHQTTADEHPTIAKQAVADMPLAIPLVIQPPISVIYAVSTENPREVDYLIPVEHPLTVQHLVEVTSQVSTEQLQETSRPEEVEQKTLTEQPLSGEIAVGNPAAIVIEGLVIQCPTTGVTIEFQEDGINASKTSTETSGVTAECPETVKCSIPEMTTDCLIEDVLKKRLIAGPAIEGQSAREVIVENVAAGGLTTIDTEEGVSTRNHKKAKKSSVLTKQHEEQVWKAQS